MIAAQKGRVNESALNTPASFKFSCGARSKKSPGNIIGAYIGAYRKKSGIKRKELQENLAAPVLKLVPRGRLELPRHSALPPQDSVSTNSTTWAQLFLYSKARTLASVFLSVPRFFPAADRRPFCERPAGGRSRTAMPTVDRKTPCVYTVFRLMSSGNRTAVAPPTPPGPKGSNGNGCCRVSGSQKGATRLRPFFVNSSRPRYGNALPGPFSERTPPGSIPVAPCGVISVPKNVLRSLLPHHAAKKAKTAFPLPSPFISLPLLRTEN